MISQCHFDISSLTDELSGLVRAACTLMSPADVTVSPPGCVLPENYCNYAKRIKQLEVRQDDIWLVSFPKCGIINSKLIRYKSKFKKIVVFNKLLVQYMLRSVKILNSTLKCQRFRIKFKILQCNFSYLAILFILDYRKCWSIGYMFKN